MSFEPLFDYCEREGRFPAEPEISQYLKVLEWEVKDQNRVLPVPVNLERYGQSNIYCIEDTLKPYVICFPGVSPLPFTAPSDREALKKLNDELSKYSHEGKPVFVRGGIILRGQHSLFEEMMNNPLSASDIWERVCSIV